MGLPWRSFVVIVVVVVVELQLDVSEIYPTEYFWIGIYRDLRLKDEDELVVVSEQEKYYVILQAVTLNWLITSPHVMRIRSYKAWFPIDRERVKTVPSKLWSQLWFDHCLLQPNKFTLPQALL